MNVSGEVAFSQRAYLELQSYKYRERQSKLKYYAILRSMNKHMRFSLNRNLICDRQWHWHEDNLDNNLVD